MDRRLFGVLALSIFIAGCASAPKPAPQADALSQLKSQISALEGQMDRKDKEIADLKKQLQALGAQLETANRARSEAESRLSQALDRLAGQSDSGSVKKPQGYIK